MVIEEGNVGRHMGLHWNLWFRYIRWHFPSLTAVDDDSVSVYVLGAGACFGQRIHRHFQNRQL